MMICDLCGIAAEGLTDLGPEVGHFQVCAACKPFCVGRPADLIQTVALIGGYFRTLFFVCRDSPEQIRSIKRAIEHADAFFMTYEPIHLVNAFSIIHEEIPAHRQPILRIFPL